MGQIIGEIVEGVFTGVQNISRKVLADRLENLATQIRRGDLVSDEALAKAQKTLQQMRNIRDQYQDG